jgi:hypothetical protein
LQTEVTSGVLDTSTTEFLKFEAYKFLQKSLRDIQGFIDFTAARSWLIQVITTANKEA